MKLIGVFLIVTGLVWAAIAYNMNTTVTTGGETIGSGAFSVYVEKSEVHNLGLMETRRNHLMFAGLSIVVGVLMFGFGSLSSESGGGNLRKCPVCAESIQPDAKKCRFCGSDLPELWAQATVPETPPHPVHDEDGHMVVRLCPSCRATNHGNASACTRCGASLPA